MSKKSKKRKRKSSSSSEEDEKTSKRKDVTSSSKSDKRRQDSSAAKEEKSVSSTIKDYSQSTRQIKKPVYRLEKTQAADQKPVNKAEEYTKTKRDSELFHRGHSSKTKNYISGKNITVEREPSKPLSTDCQKTERISKGRFDEKSSQRIPSKLKKLTSPSLVSGEQKEQKRMCRVEEPPRTGYCSNTIRASEPSKNSSVSKDSLKEKRKELVEKMCQKHQAKEFKAKWRPCTESNSPSASTTNQSSTSARLTTSHSSSEVLKNVTLVPRSVSFKIAKLPSSQQKRDSLTSPLLPTFKIPKKVQPRPVHSPADDNGAVSANSNLKHGAEFSGSRASVRQSKQDPAPEDQTTGSYLDVTPSSSSEGQDKRSSSSVQLPAVCKAATEPWYDQMQVVEELHLARTEKKLEVNVMQSYGELTCMDIDPPEEGAPDTSCKLPPQQDLILILDTNILLSHLDYVKKIRFHGLGALGFPVVLIPWVVLQELDSLKRGKGLSGSVAHLATPAISYIYNSLKSRDPYLWGQSMQQAAESSNGLGAENNDDRVLQCCLQYQSLYPESALILCTNDKNLCSKALLSGVKALSKNDVEAEAERSRHGLHPLQSTKPPVQPHANPQISSPMLSRSCTPAQPHSEGRAGLSVGLVMKHRQQISEGEDDKTKWDLSRCVSELEESLREVLSDVLEVEMKAAYEDLWLEIVYIKPPWTLREVLQCLKKHWIAVFGQIVPRTKQQTVLNLIEFFNSGEAMDRDATLAALQEAKELVKVFGKSSSRVPGAISVMSNIFNKLQPQGESAACDVVMNDDDEDKQPTHAQVSHHEVWNLFENIWSNACQISFEVFKALGFDPHTMQSAQPAGGPPPPQDVLACLHKLSSMVSQLLQAFSSVLSSAPGLEEVQTLLNIIHSNEIVNVDSRLTAVHLLDCFSQQDYREKLRFGGNKLMELKEALDRCVEATGQNVSFTST